MAINKKGAAEILYKEGIEQKEIARILRLSTVTISKYVTQNGWRKKRMQHSIRKNTAEEDALTALAHQARIIKMISCKLSDELDQKPEDALTIEELKSALIPKGEIDALQKLFTTIKGKELEWSAIVRILREFSAFLKEEQLQLAQELLPHIDKYINQKRKEM